MKTQVSGWVSRWLLAREVGLTTQRETDVYTNVRKIHRKRSYWGKLMSHVGYSVFEGPMQYPASDVQDAICYRRMDHTRET